MLFTDAYPYSIDFHLSISFPTLFFVVFSSPDFPSVGHVLLASSSQKGSVKIPRIVKFFESNLRTTFALKNLRST